MWFLHNNFNQPIDKFSCLSRFGIVHKIVKVHLTPNFFFSFNRIYLLFEEFARKSFWICLNPRFSMPSQSRAWSVAWPSFRESGAAGADDVYPGTKHNGTSVCSLYLLEKMESHIFDTITQNFCRAAVFQTFETSVSLTILFRYHVMLKD